MFPGHNFRVHTKTSAIPVCTQERNASNQEDRVEGEYTKGRTGNRVKVRNRTNTTGYLLTNTQSQQVASAAVQGFIEQQVGL